MTSNGLSLEGRRMYEDVITESSNEEALADARLILALDDLAKHRRVVILSLHQEIADLKALVKGPEVELKDRSENSV